jgi:hypothetical protein
MTAPQHFAGLTAALLLLHPSVACLAGEGMSVPKSDGDAVSVEASVPARSVAPAGVSSASSAAASASAVVGPADFKARADPLIAAVIAMKQKLMGPAYGAMSEAEQTAAKQQLRILIDALNALNALNAAAARKTALEARAQQLVAEVADLKGQLVGNREIGVMSTSDREAVRQRFQRLVYELTDVSASLAAVDQQIAGAGTAPAAASSAASAASPAALSSGQRQCRR